MTWIKLSKRAQYWIRLKQHYYVSQNKLIRFLHNKKNYVLKISSFYGKKYKNTVLKQKVVVLKYKTTILKRLYN